LYFYGFIDFNFQDFAAIIKRIADHQRWKKFTLLGHGEGAELVVLFTAAFPNMVSKRKDSPCIAFRFHYAQVTINWHSLTMF